MRKVRIVRGTYGYRNPKTGLLDPKSRTDLPFDLSADEAKRLVDMGVAEFASPHEKNTSNKTDNSNGGSSNYGAKMTQASLRRINQAALLSLAEKRGVDVSEAINNKQRADLIWDDIQAKGDVLYQSDCAADEPDDDESPPDEANMEPTGDDERTSDDEDTDEPDDDESPPDVGADAPVE